MSKITLIEKQSLEISTKIAVEAISSIRTVASLSKIIFIKNKCINLSINFFLIRLGHEQFMIDRYAAETAKMSILIRKKIAWRGLANSIAETIPTFANALTLCYGGYLVASGEIHFKDVIK